MKYEVHDLVVIGILGFCFGISTGGSIGMIYGFQGAAGLQDSCSKLKVENAELKSWAQGYEAGKGGVIGKDNKP